MNVVRDVHQMQHLQNLLTNMLVDFRKNQNAQWLKEQLSNMLISTQSYFANKPKVGESFRQNIDQAINNLGGIDKSILSAIDSVGRAGAILKGH